MKFNVIKLIFISILLIGCSDVNNQLYADTIDSNIQNINYTATGKSIDSEKLSCLDKEQNIIFLAPFDDADSTSHDYHISNDFKAIVQKLKDNGFCVDVIINKSVTYEIFQKLDNYRFVYINTHSNDRGDLTLPEEFKVDSLAEAVTKIGSGEIILKQHEVINVRSLITEGDRGFWRAIGVDFFNSLDFAKKNTLFFIHGCKALNIQPISPLSESILSSNAYGVIGFETYTSASWTERLNKEFFNNLLKKDSSAEEAIIETKANLSNSLLKDKLMALLGDINTLHLQKISDSDFILNSSGFRNSNSNSEYQTITSSTTGRVWMDRNLGADRVCTSEKDNDCYGDYYQWGRSTDGHESSTSSTTAITPSILFPNHDDFIRNNWDWTSSDSNGNTRNLNWNPCPEGFRIPTSIEFEAENIKNGADAYSKLKLPLSGNRHRTRASIDNTGSRGYIWSISPYSRNSKYLYFNANTSSVNNAHRSNGMGVRCIQN